MKNDFFAILVAAVGISATGVAVSQNLVDTVSNETDLTFYSSHLGRSVADTNYETHIIRNAVDRDPYLAATSAAYQAQYGTTSVETRQLDYQNRRSGWRLIGVEPAPTSGEIVGLKPVPEGLPAGSVEVVGAELARFRVNPGVRLYRAPSGKYYYVEDPTARGSAGADLVYGIAPEGSHVVDAASVGITEVPDGFSVVRALDGQLYLAPHGQFD
ncbi:MAG: hypothetical protein CBC49_005770 [Alphaproteobacteria bacterium TMED89]|nr:hypothetical protein [Rhodospirillaceae bacterium]RPH15068.1 MAG: hypothetical protein CBC49_005770 [Alphaproteobacteria bacterium TMED89]